MKTKRSIVHLVAYDATLEICVTDSINRARHAKAALKRYDPPAKTNFDPAGNCIWKGSKVGIYIHSDYIKHEVIGHEVYHAAGAVLTWAGVKASFGEDDEPIAHLVGNMNKLVYEQLNRWGIKIK